MKKFLLAMILCIVFLTGFSPGEAAISDYGRQVTEEFLSEFTSLFSFGRRGRNGEIISHMRFNEPEYIVDYLPHVFSEAGRTIDSDGNSITDAVFMRFGLYARDLMLFDLDNDGIPEIFIMWALPHPFGDASADRWTLHLYDNGTFQDSGRLFQATLLDLYYDYSGQILMTEVSFARFYPFVMYSYLTVENGNISTRPARPLTDDLNMSWTEETARAHHLSDEFAANPTRFDTGTPLVLIPHLTEFDALITDSIQSWLYAPDCTPVPLFREPDTGVRVRLDGWLINLHGQRTEIVDGRTLVPVRPVMEALGFNVQWNEANRSARLTKDGLDVTVQEDNCVIEIHGYGAVTLDVPVRNINGRIMVPVRAIAEISGMDVQWNNSSREVVISTGIKLEDNLGHSN